MVIFTPNKGGTTITANNTLKGNGFLLNIIMPFFKNTIQQQGQNNYDNLKALINNN